jgi:hypothetical protein
MYTAEEIDKMPIEDIEYLAEMLTWEDKCEWGDWGYSGEKFVEIRSRPRAKSVV